MGEGEELACADGLECVLDCAAAGDDDHCVAECEDQVPAAELALLDDVVACLAEHCVGVWGDGALLEDCADASCDVEQDACEDGVDG